MSDDKAQELKDLATSIYIQMAGEAGPAEWDWQPIASKAIEAAEAFNQVISARYAPQSATPTPTDPAAPAAAPDPAAVATATAPAADPAAPAPEPQPAAT